MMHVCTDCTGFGRQPLYLMVESGLQIQKFSLGDAAHHTVSSQYLQ